MTLLIDHQDGIKIIRNGHLLADNDEVSPVELALLLRVRIETVYRWLHHPTLFLPHRKEGLVSPYRYFIRVKDLKEYFKLRGT